MTVEGRVVIGLDEFMLRLGHLSALAEVAAEAGGSRNRVLRAFAEWLTQPTPVLPSDYENLGTYLVRKRLARVAQAGREVREPQQKARYSSYVIQISADGHVEGIVPPAGEPITVWREDHLLADPRTRSKVGAVTVETRDITNKSGISHLVDWALALDVLDRNLNLGTQGTVLHYMWQQENSKTGTTNPYVVIGQRLAFTWILFQADGDVLRALLERFPKGRSLDKSGALAVFEEAFQSIYEEAYGAHSDAPASAVRRIRELREDLAIPTRSGEIGRGRASTMWHRLSSRLESLVDIGLLEKVDNEGRPHPFEYVFRLTDTGDRAAAELSATATIDEWLSCHAAGSAAETIGITTKCGAVPVYVYKAVNLLRGPGSIHIDSCALLAASLALIDGGVAELGPIRHLLVETAVKRPDIARLARGYSGTLPEHVTFDFRLLEIEGPAAFAASNR